ncbi:MAG: polyprenyl synthetase family protein [Alphaproteobacteria bacterium]|nr:polyprenyl synthetase family protein [Alphaproteobacteria bacterium]
MRDEVNARLDQLLPDSDHHPASLHEAMRYSLLGSGKRVRPLLCVLVSEAADGAGRSFALDAGCAVEMVHTASLILDDLPCMDDAGMRRGRPTTHREFGQATSILASVGLLNRAFGVISEQHDIAPAIRSRALEVLSEAVGSNGMIAGQEIDLHERRKYDHATPIESVNWLKTGVLFVASAHIGALAADLRPEIIGSVNDFARHVGLAFQTADDLIDRMGDAQSIGKDVGQDADIPTLASISGTQSARLSCEDNLRQAHNALNESGLHPAGLTALVDSIFGASLGSGA